VAKTQAPRKKRKKIHHKKQQKKSQVVFRTLTVLIASFVVLMAGMLTWYTQGLRAVTDQESYQMVTIPQGSTTGEIASILTEKQLIRNKTVFTLHARMQRGSAIQAGSYRLSPHQSVSDIMKVITSGQVSTVNTLIPPGQRVDQIVVILVDYGYERQEVEGALQKIRDHPILEGVGRNDLLEGYIFPDTYQIAPNTSAEQLLRAALDNFQNRIAQDPTISQGLMRQGISFEDAVNIASIVQMEVPDYETQQKVAQVFLKRYKEGMPLGADPTFKYAAAMTNQPALPSIDSPYNTRKYTGLPPTAIANFNIEALRAVANPAPTNYVYFVSGDDGITRFSRTFEEHQQLINQYCIKLCQL
jgi:UPF0755 protein